MMKGLIVLFLFSIPHLALSQTLTVCDVLEHLSEFNGKEVRIRAIWLSGDSESILWASPDCPHPIIRDGWVWLSSINVGPDDIRHFLDFGSNMARLKRENPEKLLAATFTGVLHTRDHFKIGPYSRLPIGYGYSVASLVFSKAEDLEVVSLGAGEQTRLMRESQFPAPRKVHKSR